MSATVETRMLTAPEGSRLMPSQANPQVTDLQAQPASSVNLVQVGLNRLPLLLIGLVAGIIGGFFYHLRVVPTFQTTVNVQVVKKKAGENQSISDGRMGYVDDFVAAQLAVLKSPSVIEKAADILEKESGSGFSSMDGLIGLGGVGAKDSNDKTNGLSDLDKNNPLSGKKLPLGATSKAELGALIHAGLTPTKDEKIGVLVLTFKTAKNPEDSGKVLKAVMDGYQKFLEEQYSKANNLAVQKMDSIIEANKVIILKDQTELKFKQEKLKKINPPVGARKESDLLENKVSRMDAAIVEVKDRMDELNARYGGVQVIGRAKSADPEAMAILTPDETTLNSLDLELKLLLTDYGNDHPKVKKVKTTIAHLKEIKKKRDDLRIAGKDGYDSDNPLEREKQYYKKKLDSLEEAIKIAKDRLDELKESVEEEKELDNYCKDLIKKIENLSRRIEDAEIFKNQIDQTREHGGYEARAISKIIGPFASGANRLVYLFVGGILGLGAGFGLAYLAEVTDRSFQTPDEIRKQLGHTILGHIPTIRIDQDERKIGSKVEAQLCTFHKPKSTEAEAYRGLRTGLYFSTQNRGHQVIQITSPNAGDGKSTLSGNLSISIAQSGKRVVLIDADMRKPRVHKIFGLENQTKGLSTLIENTSTIADSTLTTEVPNLFLIPCGPRPANPAELLTVPRFPQLLEELRQLYDIVIVDTPPLLAVSDPCIVAPRVDGVILNILLNKSARTSAVRACEMLAGIDAKVLGVVVNCFDAKMRSGAYGYSYTYGYKYSYKYGYRYGYGYNYGYSDYTQYSDDKESSKKQLKNKDTSGKLPKTNV